MLATQSGVLSPSVSSTNAPFSSSDCAVRASPALQADTRLVLVVVRDRALGSSGDLIGRLAEGNVIENSSVFIGHAENGEIGELEIGLVSISLYTGRQVHQQCDNSAITKRVWIQILPSCGAGSCRSVQISVQLNWVERGYCAFPALFSRV